MGSQRTSLTIRLAGAAAFSPRRARLLLAGTLWALALTTCPRLAAQATPDERPNILVFVGDDLGWRDTGPYGNHAIHTPNIDRLSRSGLRIERAFGTTPQCSPSRISVLTGRYPHATRAEDLHTPLPAAERLLPFWLQREGPERPGQEESRATR